MCHRLASIRARSCRVRHRPEHFHHRLWPTVVLCQRNHPWLVFYALSVAKPVAYLKLQPACREQIERCRRREAFTRHGPPASTRGLGLIIAGAGSCHVSARGAFRPNRVPALPMNGHCRSLEVHPEFAILPHFGVPRAAYPRLPPEHQCHTDCDLAAYSVFLPTLPARLRSEVCSIRFDGPLSYMQRQRGFQAFA